MLYSELSPKQKANAFEIYKVAIVYGEEVAKACLMASGDEASLLRYGNRGQTTRADVPQRWRDIAALSLNCNPDIIASGAAWTTADSVGLYQQRAMMGYCTPDQAGINQLMDLKESTLIFIRGSFGGTGDTSYYLQAPADLSIAAKIQWTQGSEYPDGKNYELIEAVADILMASFKVLAPPTPKPFTVIDWVLQRLH